MVHILLFFLYFFIVTRSLAHMKKSTSLPREDSKEILSGNLRLCQASLFMYLA